MNKVTNQDLPFNFKDFSTNRLVYKILDGVSIKVILDSNLQPISYFRDRMGTNVSRILYEDIHRDLAQLKKVVSNTKIENLYRIDAALKIKAVNYIIKHLPTMQAHILLTGDTNG